MASGSTPNIVLPGSNRWNGLISKRLRVLMINANLAGVQSISVRATQDLDAWSRALETPIPWKKTIEPVALVPEWTVVWASVDAPFVNTLILSAPYDQAYLLSLVALVEPWLAFNSGPNIPAASFTLTFHL